MSFRSRIFPYAILLALVGAALSAALPATAQTSQVPQISPERKAVLDRLQALSVTPLNSWRVSTDENPRGDSTELDDTNWKTIEPGGKWTTETAWIRRWIEVPATLGGYDVRGAILKLTVIAWGIDKSRYFVNGIPYEGAEEQESSVLVEHAEPGQKFLVAIYMLGPANKDKTFREARLTFEAAPGRPDPAMLRVELLSAEELVRGLSPENAERNRALDAAYRAVDFAALDRGDAPGFESSLRQAEQALQPLREWMQGYSIRAAGNAHIDMAWLWPWTETVDVVKRTFSSALQLMREFPDFTFTHSSAHAYMWMEEKYPPMFDEIRKRVREGRWEPIGGMWVEPDLNIPDGESLVRQLLLGKRYFKEKFGVEIRTGWNPDSFGYNWQLPQIYKKSGIDSFVTQKMAWNDTTKFPYKLFWWESPDGSRVLTYFPHDYVNFMQPAPMAKDLAEYATKMRYPEMLYLYGVGDHGGGPTRNMLETAEQFRKQAVYPKLQLGTVQPYFDELAKKAPSLNLPVWKSELYFEYHRGIFTTQAAAKKGNRESEALLLTAEKFSSLASRYGRRYPKEDLKLAWTKVLFNQFHDIAAGSGIAALYADSARDYAEVARIGKLALDSALQELTAQINTQGIGVPVVVFNSLSWKRTDVVEADVQLPAPARSVKVFDPKGRRMPAEVISAPGTVPQRIRFVAEDVPPTGYKVFRVMVAGGPGARTSTLKAGKDFLENEFFRVRVDARTGCITSLWDKTQNWEALAANSCGNLLQAFRDKPRAWDAWNIDADFEAQKWDLNAADEVNLVERGPLRAVLRVRKHFQNSTFVQDIILYPRVQRVDVHMHASWHEKHILLKVAFPVAAQNEQAAYEIPFGSINRPTTRRTPEEKAKFEVPALRWADLSDASHGLSLLNDCKYGYDTRDNVVRLTLLRSPEWPDPHADEGEHDIVYSFYPHSGGWKEGGTMQHGYELNYKLIPVAATVHAGKIPAVHSFVEIEPSNLILTAAKQTEDGDDLLLRFYEFAGQQTSARIVPPAGVAQISETNLMEQPEKEIPFDGKALSISVGPYEIKTLRLRFAPGKAQPR